MLCSSCRGQCQLDEGVEIACPNCDEAGCEECNNTGYYQITECPKTTTRELVPFIRTSDLFESGIPPISGGSLEQADVFLSAHQYYRNELSRIELDRINDR